MMTVNDVIAFAENLAATTPSIRVGLMNSLTDDYDYWRVKASLFTSHGIMLHDGSKEVPKQNYASNDSDSSVTITRQEYERMHCEIASWRHTVENLTKLWSASEPTTLEMKL